MNHTTLALAGTLLLILLSHKPLHAQTEARLRASDPNEDNQFGKAVSVWDDLILIGSNDDLRSSTDAGKAYLFERQADNSWVEIAELTASDGQLGDTFGHAVSLQEGRALVTAVFDDASSGEANTGSAYLFERQVDGSWEQITKLTADDAAVQDHFGFSGALNGDLVAIGARQQNAAGANSGAVYLFERQGSGQWVQTEKLLGDDTNNIDFFGYSLDLQANRLLVGAFQNENNGLFTGSAYIFERNTSGNWNEVDKLSPGDGATADRFGFDVALDGDRAIIGATQDDDNGAESGSAYVFERTSSGDWVEVMKLVPGDGQEDDAFGTSVLLEGNTAYIGAPGASNASGERTGKVYVFERQDSGLWTETSSITTSSTQAGDAFGAAIDGTSTLLAIGSPDQDHTAEDAGAVYALSLDMPQVTDNEAPDCKILDVVKGPPTRVHVGLQDGLSGIATIEVLKARNAELIFSQYPGQAFHTGDVISFANVPTLEFNGVKINQRKRATIVIRATDQAGNSVKCDPVLTTLASALPERSALNQNYPNPFSRQTTIPVLLAEDMDFVSLRVFDLSGKEVFRLLSGAMPAGRHALTWEGIDHAGNQLPSGMYVYRLTLGHRTEVKKMILLQKTPE